MLKRIPLKLVFAAAVLVTGLAPRGVRAQQESASRCMTPDSIAVRGNVRVAESRIRTEAGLQAARR